MCGIWESKKVMGELEDLRQAIRALQAQRSLLGDSVVDSATYETQRRNG